MAKPTPAQQPKPESWGHWTGRTLRNIPKSAAGVVTGAVDAVTHPGRTLNQIERTADAGALLAIEAGLGRVDPAGAANRRQRLDKLAREVPGAGSDLASARAIVKPFTSGKNFGAAVADDPVGMALTVAPALGVAGKALRLPGIAERAAAGAKIGAANKGASLASRAGGAVKGAAKMARDKAPITGPEAKWTTPTGGGAANSALARAAAFADRDTPPVIRQVTRPEFVDKHSRRAAPVIARARGSADLAKQRHLSKLEGQYRAFNGVDREGQRDFVRHIEGTPTRRPLSPELLAAADEVRTVLADAGGDLNAATGVELRQRYFPHDWEASENGPAEPRRPSKVGSGAQTKARTFDTLDDGLRQGLREKHAHPLDAVSFYLEDTYNRIAHENVLADLRKTGQARWVPERGLPEGWAKLEGPGTVKDAIPLRDPEGDITGLVGRRVLAAPESVARLHNNRLAPSIKDTPLGPLAKPVMGAANVARTSLLGAGSLAHTMLTSVKAFGSELGRGANEFLRGHPVDAAGAVAHSFVAPVSLVRRGAEMERNLLRYGPRSEVEKLYVQAGGRVKGSASYERNMQPSWYESARRRAFVQDLSKDLDRIRSAKGIRGKGAAGAEVLGRALKTVNHFTFKYQVPAVKRGVFDAEMQYFLKNNPGVGPAEKLAYARRVLGSIDNRFGEMVADNNFWHTWYEEASRVALLSPSWVQGNVRLFGDAMKDAPRSLVSALKGKGMGAETSAMFGVWASRTLVAGMLTYLLAGELPAGMDWVAPRTGGENPDGSAERMQVLSSMKDIDQLVYGGNLPDEIYGKLNPAIQTTAELLRNRDYFDRPIYRPEGAEPVPNGGENSRAYDAGTYVLERNAPIAVQSKPDNPASRVPDWTRLVGIMPAGQRYSNPEKREENERKYGTQAWRRAVASRRKQRGER